MGVYVCVCERECVLVCVCESMCNSVFCCEFVCVYVCVCVCKTECVCVCVCRIPPVGGRQINISGVYIGDSSSDVSFHPGMVAEPPH